MDDESGGDKIFFTFALISATGLSSSGMTSNSTFKFALDNLLLPWRRRLANSILLMMISEGFKSKAVANDSLTLATKLSFFTKLCEVSPLDNSRSKPKLTVYVTISTTGIVVVVPAVVVVVPAGALVATSA